MSLQEIAINSSFRWLFMIFWSTDTFNRLPLLSELVNDGHTIIKMHKRWSFQPACLWIQPVTRACKDNEAELNFPHSYPIVVLHFIQHEMDGDLYKYRSCYSTLKTAYINESLNTVNKQITHIEPDVVCTTGMSSGAVHIGYGICSWGQHALITSVLDREKWFQFGFSTTYIWLQWHTNPQHVYWSTLDEFIWLNKIKHCFSCLCMLCF